MNTDVQGLMFILLFPLSAELYLTRLVVWENVSELAQLCRLHQLERTWGGRGSSSVNALNSQMLCLCI